MGTVTIVLPVSRPDYLKRIFAQLDLMPCDNANTNIITIVDGGQQLIDLNQALTAGSKFKQRLSVARKQGIPSVGSVRGRRTRIATIHNELKQYVKLMKSDYVFCLEDDTLFPLNTLQKLLKGFEQYPYAGFITGLELGRWGWPAIGAYHVNDVYEPTELTSLKSEQFKDFPIQTQHGSLILVDAAGLYGCLIKTENYINHEFKPFMDGILGPDVEFGLAMRREGLLNFADLSLKYTHLTRNGNGNIDFGNTKVVQVKVSKIEDGKWEQKII